MAFGDLTPLCQEASVPLCSMVGAITTIAGSHGIEAVLASGQKTRKNSAFCCEDFYDITHMHPHLISMKMVPKAGNSSSTGSRRFRV